jgi:hypothetical protein
LSFSQNLNLQPLTQILSYQQLSLHKSYQINKKNDWINIFLHYEFAQNELEVQNKSLCDYLFVSQMTSNSYRHPETQAYLHENLIRGI